MTGIELELQDVITRLENIPRPHDIEISNKCSKIFAGIYKEYGATNVQINVHILEELNTYDY